MTNNGISSELQKFIGHHIHSMEQIEILCLLAKSPSKSWSEEEVFKYIQSSRDSVAANLRSFCANHILTFESQTGYRFSPEPGDRTRLAWELVKLYRERRVTVIEVIYKKRTDPIRDFAEAFRIRKEKP